MIRDKETYNQAVKDLNALQHQAATLDTCLPNLPLEATIAHLEREIDLYKQNRGN